MSKITPEEAKAAIAFGAMQGCIFGAAASNAAVGYLGWPWWSLPVLVSALLACKMMWHVRAVRAKRRR